MFSDKSKQIIRKAWSIRIRIAAIFVMIFGSTLIVFSALLYQVFVQNQQAEFDAALFNHAIDVTQSINIDFFGDLSVYSKPLSDDGKVFPFPLGKSFLQILSLEGKVIARSRSLGHYQLPLAHHDLELTIRRGVSFQSIPSEKLPRLSKDKPEISYRLLNYIVDRPSLPRLILQIAVPMTLLERERASLLTFFMVSIPLVLGIATLGGLYLSRKAMAPVRKIIEKSKQIRATRLSERVPVPSDDVELQELALTLNDLLNRLEQAFNSQERFIADASHQLKTPLSILRGELDLIRNQPRSMEEMAEFLSSASQEIDYLSRMVSDLLVLARIDSGKGALSISQVRLDEIVLETISRLEPLAKKREIRIRLNLSRNSLESQFADFEAKGDPDLIQCMLQSLIENAIKFSPDRGAIDVNIIDEKEQIHIQVKDEGPGISPEILSKIFNRFFRDPKAKEKTSGAGLGLPIAQQIAEAHGGSVTVESTLGQGTLFNIQIKKS